MNMDAGRTTKQEQRPFRAFTAVFWAFLGIRKGSASQGDLSSLKPWQVLAAGVTLAVAFVSVLVTLVRSIAG